MTIALVILAAWVVLAFIGGQIAVSTERHRYEQRLLPPEADIIARAGRDWIKTGRHDQRYIDELEARRTRKPGFWRKIARQG